MKEEGRTVTPRAVQDAESQLLDEMKAVLLLYQRTVELLPL